jgi:hypothetical protein
MDSQLITLISESDQLEAALTNTLPELDREHMKELLQTLSGMLFTGDMYQMLIMQLATYGLGKLLQDTNILEQLRKNSSL